MSARRSGASRLAGFSTGTDCVCTGRVAATAVRGRIGPLDPNSQERREEFIVIVVVRHLYHIHDPYLLSLFQAGMFTCTKNITCHRYMSSKILDEREICDLECLASEIFAPLKTYMTKAQYVSCLSTMTLDGSAIFSIPITLGLTEEVAPGTVVTLKTVTGTILASVTVSECWAVDYEAEWNAVFGTTDVNHPYIQYQKSKGYRFYVAGPTTFTDAWRHIHGGFAAARKTPAVLRATGPWIGFQTRNPLHRSHIELIKRAAASVPGGRVLLHPVEGVTQECDIPFPVRMKCYREVLPELGANAELAILPLSMRMAGPREAVWHAVIRRNHGCSHFIVGRDHAGPSYRKKDGSAFYDPFAAQRLAKSLEAHIGLTILASEELVYCEEVDRYEPMSQSAGYTTRQISGTELRRRLAAGEDVPRWFSYPEVVRTLKDYYGMKQGVCFYFVGLSGAGKSTLAEALKGYLEETYPHRPVTLLDADVIRMHLSKGLGFSREDRSMNVRRIGYVASEIVKHGGIVIVANIAPYAEDREWNRRLISSCGSYVEIFVDTPIEECEKRDIKGLYAAARAGKITGFTGVSDPFEPPQNPDLLVGRGSKEEDLSAILQHAKRLHGI